MRITAIALATILLAATFLPLSAGTLKDDFSFVSPRPGAELVSKETTLIFKPRGGTAVLPDLVVTGTTSGVITGDWVRSDDNKTLIFRPHRVFEPGEKVSVTVVGRDKAHVSYGFKVSPSRTRLAAFEESCDCEMDTSPVPGEKVSAHKPHLAPQSAFPFPSDFPTFSILANNNPDPRTLFYVNGFYLVALENDGTPTFSPGSRRF